MSETAGRDRVEGGGPGAAPEAATPPEPLPLHDYVLALDDWIAGRPPRNPFAGSLIESCAFGDRERSEFLQGRRGLWKLIPPITVAEIEEAELEPPALLALALAVVLQGRHALAALPRSSGGVLPETLRQTEKTARFVSEQLDAADRRGVAGALVQLAALRADLQEVRQAQGLRGAAPAPASPDAVASARIGEQPRKEGWLLRKLRAVTEPGVRAPAKAAVEEPVPAEPSQVWATEPQVPPPLGLYHYITALDHWVAGTPLDEPYLAGLLAILGYGDADGEEYRNGRAGLWGLVPPIGAAEVAEADLDVAASRALALAFAVWARHVLAFYRPVQRSGIPGEVREAGDIVAALLLALSEEPGSAERAAGGRLLQLGADIEARGAISMSALADRRAAIATARRSEAEARRLRDDEAIELARAARLAATAGGRSVNPVRLGIGVGLLVLGIVALVAIPEPESLPSAIDYGELPAVAILRYEESVTVRVDASWLAIPIEQRTGQVGALWHRFGVEMKRPERPVDLLVVDRRNTPIGGMRTGEVWWQEPAGETPAALEPAPIPAVSPDPA